MGPMFVKLVGYKINSFLPFIANCVYQGILTMLHDLRYRQHGIKTVHINPTYVFTGRVWEPFAKLFG